MIRCVAVKRKGDTQQCPKAAVKGHTLCGTHAKAKKVELWRDVREKDVRIVKCQSVARRWFVLHRLRLAGPGVLKRKNLSNEDDLVTCVESNRQHPFDYFAFDEAGKVWWFDFGTLWTWSMKTHEPSNPYTRVKLDTDTRKRLREMWAFRARHHLIIPSDPVGADDRINSRWNLLCQLFVDNGFIDVTPGQLTRLSKSSHVAMWKFIRDDLANKNESPFVWCSYMLGPEMLHANTPTYIVNSLRILLRFLTCRREPYPLVFSTMSAIYRC